MTTANKITILRILLIPFFVTETIYYVRTGNEIHRLAAIYGRLIERYFAAFA